MATDPRPAIRPLDAEADSLIDNELPAYRALSPLAIVSVILGLASILVFTSPYFAILGALAIVSGLLAQRQIRKQPEVWTGAKPSTVGIALSLIFTLSAFTITGVQSWIYGREATKFATAFGKFIDAGTVEDLIYLKAMPHQRAGKTATQVAGEMQAGVREAQEFAMTNAGIISLGKRMAETPRPTAQFQKLASQAADGMTLYVSAQYKLTGGSGSNGDDYVLLQFRGDVQAPGYGWFVESVKYPYTPTN